MKRWAWLSALALVVACASAPEPVKRKKKKRKKDRIELKEKAEDQAAKDEAPKDEDDDSVTVTDEDSDDETKPKRKTQKRVAAADDGPVRKKKKAEPEEEPVRKKKKAEPEPEEEPVRKKKKAEPEEQPVAKKKKAEPEEQPVRKKKKAEPEPEEEPIRKKKNAEPEPEEEPVRKKKKAEPEPEEEPVRKKKKAEAEPEPEEEPVRKKTKAEQPKPKREAKPKRDKQADEADVPTVDMTEEKPATKQPGKAGAGEENVIEMEGDDDPPTETRVAAAPVPGVEEEDKPAPTPVDTTTIPRAINDRSLTVPKSRLEVHAGFNVATVTLPDAAGIPVSTTSQGLTLGVAYGLGKKLEVGFDYAPTLNPGDLAAPLSVHGAYRLVESAKFDLAVAAAFAADSLETTDPATMMTVSSTSLALQIGAWARYRLGRKLALFTGVPATPSSTVSLSKLTFALPPLGYNLTIGLNNGGAIAVEVPIGVGYQITAGVYAFASLDLAHIRIANTENAFVFADFIPIAIGGFYSFDKFDVGAVFSDDLKQAGDYLRFEVLARYAIK